VSSIFAQPDPKEVWVQHGRVVEQLEKRFSEAAKMLADAAEDILAFTAFTKSTWRQAWSNNPQERLNREIRRRTDVVGIFPNRPAVVRLVGAVLAEQNDVWAVACGYTSADALQQAQADQQELREGIEAVKQLAALSSPGYRDPRTPP
jgi:transposase-like protein